MYKQEYFIGIYMYAHIYSTGQKFRNFSNYTKNRENSCFQDNLYSENVVYYSAYNCIIVQSIKSSRS